MEETIYILFCLRGTSVSGSVELEKWKYLWYFDELFDVVNTRVYVYGGPVQFEKPGFVSCITFHIVHCTLVGTDPSAVMLKNRVILKQAGADAGTGRKGHSRRDRDAGTNVTSTSRCCNSVDVKTLTS